MASMTGLRAHMGREINVDGKAIGTKRGRGSMRLLVAVWVIAWLIGPLVLTATSPVSAQGEVSEAPVIVWSEPVNVSRSPGSSAYAAVVADSFGTVHAFWSEATSDTGSAANLATDQRNAIMHSQWDGYSWTDPIAVLYVPNDGIAEFLSIEIDGDNILHAVWAGQRQGYYSAVAAQDAGSARAWSVPVVVAESLSRSLWPLDIAVCPAGILHLVYADSSDVVHATCSYDAGITWEVGRIVSKGMSTPETGVANVRLLADPSGRLHATWQTHDSAGFGQAVYYTRSIDGGVQWSRPYQMAYREPGDRFTEDLTIVVTGADELHAFYLDGSIVGRCHSVSYDGGESWTPCHPIITEMEGKNGFMAPVTGSTGQLYLIIDLRTRSNQRVGIYYSRWLDGLWTPVRAVDNTSIASREAHFTAATVRLGNEIHILYNEMLTSSNGGYYHADIWHVWGEIVGVNPLEEAQAGGGMEDPTAAASFTGAAIERPTDVPTPLVRTDKPPEALGPGAGILYGGGSALLAVGILILRRLHTRDQ
ncbi:MAG: exo-alpha-sialidase [Anaerolineae bacterium]